ncbi:unnamed protein product [Heterobilharzia americana]|nr:unnamed protein product [Heterobilharzia americana]
MLDSSVAPERLVDSPKSEIISKSYLFSNYSLEIKANFSNCRLKNLSTSIQSLKFTESLDLSSNQITNLPSRIKECSLLTVLNLSFNKIFSLPSFLCDLSNLRSLLISNNFLSSLPSNFSKLKYLQELDLSFNGIKVFPSTICSLHNLKVLMVGSNLIEELPEEISDLRELRILDLRSNKLKHLPLNLRFMLCLERLSLEDNPLCSPPIAIVSRGIPYVFAFLNQQAQLNSDNISCGKYHDSLTDSSFPIANTVKPALNQQPTSCLITSIKKPEILFDSTQKTLSKHEISSSLPSTSAIQNTDTSANIIQVEHPKNQDENVCRIECSRSEGFNLQNDNHNESSLSSCEKEKSKSGSSISSLSTDEEPLAININYLASLNSVYDKNAKVSDNLKSNISHEFNHSDSESSTKHFTSICNVNTNMSFKSVISDKNDGMSKSSAVEWVNGYVSTNETLSSDTDSQQINLSLNGSENNVCVKYDRCVKGGRLTSSSRFRCSKRQQMAPERFLQVDPCSISSNSHYPGKSSASQRKVYRHRSFSHCHRVTTNANQNSYRPLRSGPDKYELPKATRIGVAMCIPSESVLKSPALQFTTNHQNSNVLSTNSSLNNNASMTTETLYRSESECMKINQLGGIIKWEDLYPEGLNKIHQLRRIIDKELNIHLPVSPKHLAIELSTGVILVHLVNKLIGPTTNIKICLPRNDQMNMLSEAMKSYRRNIRRCREWIHRFGVPSVFDKCNLFSSHADCHVPSIPTLHSSLK